MIPNLEIRKALVSEAESLSALALESKAHWGYSAETIESWKGQLRISPSDVASRPTFVAAIDGDVAGFYSLVPSERAWDLDNLWVAPHYLRRGVGRALLDHALEIAFRGGASSVTVDADPNAEAFYLSCGATRSGAIPAPIPGEPDRVRPQLVFSGQKHMFGRALLAFIALPGMVAFAIPAAWLWQAKHLRLDHPPGLVLLAAGVAGLLWCVRDFYVQGKGTLAPWSPPQNLVVVGLYRFSRNPMYVCVVLIILGWAAAFASPGLLAYAGLMALGFHLRVVYAEEPWLEKKHGGNWQAYASQVPRWFGVVRTRITN